MTTKPISNEEYSPLKIANLPTRPTAPLEFGGRGYSPTELKCAFDALPMLAINRINSLLADICCEGEDSISGEIKTGIKSAHTLRQFFNDLTDGQAAAYIRVLDTTLAECLVSLIEDISEIKALLERNEIK